MYFIPALKAAQEQRNKKISFVLFSCEFFLEIFSSVQQSIMSLKVLMSEVHFRESTNDSQLKITHQTPKFGMCLHRRFDLVYVSNESVVFCFLTISEVSVRVCTSAAYVLQTLLLHKPVYK